MQAVDARDMIFLQKPGFTEGLCPAGRLLRRLEDQKDVPLRTQSDTRQVLRQPEQDGHVSVMAAGVHFARMAGGKGQTGRLLKGKRIHIAAEGGRLRPAVVKISADRALPRGKHPAGKPGQDAAQVGGRLRQPAAQLRNTVQGDSVL